MEELKNALIQLLDRVDPKDPIVAMDILSKRFEAETGLPCPGRKTEKMAAFDEAYYTHLCDAYNDWRTEEWSAFCKNIRKILNESD